MKKYILNDEKLRELLSGTKLSASETLKYRVMHQIEAEKALTPQKSIKSTKPLLRTVLSIAAVVYVLVVALGIWAYSEGGMSALASTEFLLPVIAISSISAVCGLIVVIDEKRYL